LATKCVSEDQTVKIVTRSDIDTIVISAGWIDLDLEVQCDLFNYGKDRKIMPGTRMILKDIVGDYAFVYNNNGVMRFPYALLEPWEN